MADSKQRATTVKSVWKAKIRTASLLTGAEVDKMLDTVHLEVPRVVEYAKSFLPILDATRDIESDVWRRTNGKQPYRWIGNLESVGIPALVHQEHRWNHKTGDKIEFIGAGAMTISKMVHTARQIYNFNAADALILRIDATADVRGVPVSWFREHVRTKFKKRHRAWGHWNEVSMGVAETITAGDKPIQYRIYDKTGERLHQLQAMRRSLSITEREICTFEAIWNYSPDVQVTRVERQMGAREPARCFGVKYFGDIAEMASKKVFTNLVFPETTRTNFEGLTGSDYLAGMYLLDFRERHGLQNTINEMKRAFPKRTFTRKFPLFERFLHQNRELVGVTQKALTEEYRTSTLVQLAA